MLQISPSNFNDLLLSHFHGCVVRYCKLVVSSTFACVHVMLVLAIWRVGYLACWLSGVRSVEADACEILACRLATDLTCLCVFFVPPCYECFVVNSVSCLFPFRCPSQSRAPASQLNSEGPGKTPARSYLCTINARSKSTDVLRSIPADTVMLQTCQHQMCVWLH